ncbi:MAG: VWA domain-containing protein [Pseudomonadales bacterium]|nr:VWA domain-containing protein [Pseudomonadales bacterium]
MIENFHFLRPEWFYALIPAVALFVILRLRSARGSNWEKTIDPGFLPFLLESPGGKRGSSAFAWVLLAWILATIALAGPVFRKIPQPVHEREDALVIVFDLTRSMYAEDVKPNRLIRARRKLQDLLAMRKEGVTALVVYAGDAHTVSPLTDDAATIAEMIPAISPEIMPEPGSHLAPALERAVSLFKDAGVGSGRILVITDEIRDLADAQSVARENRFNYPVSVLSVGTADGAPIPGHNFDDATGYLKDANGVLIIPKVDFNAMQSFANLSGGRFSRMTLTDEDLDYLLADEGIVDEEAYREVERDFDTWVEEGPWLLLLLLPIAALAFRRGWVWMFALVMILPPAPAQASWWDDLWQTRNQQAAEAMKEGNTATAAQLFENPAWKGTAHYRSKDYESAAAQFTHLDTSDGKYNLGNALARAGSYEKAISAYDDALKKDPDNEDAKFNKELVENLLKNQQKQKQKQDQQHDKKQQQDQSKSQDQNGKGSQDQSGQQTSQQQQQDQQAQEKKEQETQQQKQQQAEDQQKQAQQQMAQQDDAPLDDEQKQALEQWLRRVPDDPGGLLRRKFQLQHDERQRNGRNANRDSSDW